MAEQDSTPDQNLIEQYEVGDETSVVESPVESSVPPTVETAPVPRDSQGRFVSTSTPDSAAPSHPAYLVRMAKQAGFTDEEIQGIPPEALGLAVAHVQETRQAERHEARVEHQRVTDQARPPMSESPAPPRREPEPDVGLSPEEFDPQLVSVMKKTTSRLDRLEAENNALKAEVQQLRNAHMSERNETLTQKIDRLFSTQPKERFGEGPGKHLAKDSPEMKRRLAILREMETLPAGDLDANFEKAVTTLYGAAKPLPPAEKELEARKEQWARGGVSRPTHRVGAPEQNGVHKATNSVAGILKDMGASGGEDTTSPDEFLGD